MLRLSAHLSLNIYPPKPSRHKNQNGEESKPTDHKGILSGISPKFNVVGHERGGYLLVATDRNEEGIVRTFIDLLDLNTKIIQQIYRHPETIEIIGASINQERTLVGFTIRKRSPVNLRHEDLYESFVADIHPKGRCFSMGVRKEAQRIWFLWPESDADQAKKTMSYFLFIINEEVINLFQVLFKAKSDGIIKMITLPTLRTVLVKGFVWCEWDVIRGYLFVISKPPKLPSSKPSDHLLRCFSFPDKKITLFEKEEKEAILIFEIQIQLQLEKRNSQVETYYLSSYNFMAQTQPLHQYIHMVQMRSGGLCLCHQRWKSETQSLDVAIFILHTKLKLDFNIQLENSTSNLKTPPRLLFDTLGDMLMLYIPGMYLQFIDCGHDHGPSPNLIATGDDVPKIPGYGLEDAPIVTSFDLFNPVTSPSGPDVHSHYFLECRTGCVFEFSFQLEEIWKVLELSDPACHVHWLHVAIIHIRDPQIIKKFIMKVIQEYPHVATPELFSEYLLGTSFLEMSSKLKTITEAKIERSMPLSGIENYFNESLQTKQVTLSPIQHYSMAANTKILKEKEEEKRFSLFVPNSAEMISSPPPAAMATTPGMSKFFRDLLGFQDSNRHRKPLQVKREKSLDLEEKLWVDHLGNFLGKSFPKEKPLVVPVAQEYQKILHAKIDHLLHCIEETDPNRNLTISFSLRESFASSLQELGLLPSSEFSAEFLRLGYRCLPRGIFVQYVHRGIFELDQQFLEGITTQFSQSNFQADLEFVYFITSRYTNQMRVVTMLNSNLEYFTYLTQYLISKIPITNLLNAVPSESDALDMEITNDSSFIPLTIFLHAVQNAPSLDREVLRVNAEKFFMDLFGGTDELDEEIPNGTRIAKKPSPHLEKDGDPIDDQVRIEMEEDQNPKDEIGLEVPSQDLESTLKNEEDPILPSEINQKDQIDQVDQMNGSDQVDYMNGDDKASVDDEEDELMQSMEELPSVESQQNGDRYSDEESANVEDASASRPKMSPITMEPTEADRSLIEGSNSEIRL
eukprot:TRINITY_DN1261_c1_g1_i3.p1 TRINITY_DN1261_c1_g1~~TRINITY_DN1261_c1_g1_i3.p1  ORF type:complete len:1022 (+),score=330.04 TRINITY_DN1261_c1_g1_i3:47-3112(+)